MLLPLLLSAAALTLQVAAPSDTAPARGDSTRQRSICISLGGGCSADSTGKRIPVTPQHLATAFRDTAARTLLLRARAARMQQDSAIISYDATAYQRMSAGMRVGRVGRDRVMFRSESASRVRWHRDIGAHIDVLGARSVFPGATQGEANREMVDDVSDMTLLPYYPGQESLWIGNGMAKSQVNEDELVHPLADGAEAYYTYATGDAAGFRLPDGRQVRLQELEVRPRRVSWNVVVGSLWFDADRGQNLPAAIDHVAHYQIRNRGTVGGSLAHDRTGLADSVARGRAAHVDSPPGIAHDEPDPFDHLGGFDGQLSGDPHREGTGPLLGEVTHPGAAGEQCVPGGRDVPAERGRRAEPGDDDVCGAHVSGTPR